MQTQSLPHPSWQGPSLQGVGPFSCESVEKLQPQPQLSLLLASLLLDVPAHDVCSSEPALTPQLSGQSEMPTISSMVVALRIIIVSFAGKPVCSRIWSYLYLFCHRHGNCRFLRVYPAKLGLFRRVPPVGLRTATDSRKNSEAFQLYLGRSRAAIPRMPGGDLYRWGRSWVGLVRKPDNGEPEMIGFMGHVASSAVHRGPERLGGFVIRCLSMIICQVHEMTQTEAGVVFGH